MSKLQLAACVFAMTVSTASFAHAQRVGTLGTSGLGGANSFGNSAFGSSSFGTSGLGSSFGSGFGSSGFGGSGFGSSAFGSGVGGTGGFGSSSFGSSGLGGSSFGTFGAGGQNFVGRDSSDMANVWNQLGKAGTQYFTQMNRSMSRANTGSQQQAAKVQNTPQKMLVNLRVAFTPSRPSPSEFSTTIHTRLARILASQNIAAPQLTMEGDVAVLRGVAATESQRLVLEKLVAMEPGVSAVRNEMTVAGTTATE